MKRWVWHSAYGAAWLAHWIPCFIGGVGMLLTGAAHLMADGILRGLRAAHAFAYGKGSEV